MNISFVYPSFLAALTLLAIPVIIHLFDFRRFKKVFFTNVGFLKELKQETTSSSRLRHLVVLLCRMLAFLFLVLTFSQPYIPIAEGGKLAASRVVSVYIDNSYSMEAVSREGTLLDVARIKGAQIASAFRPSDKFHLVTNNFDPAHQRLVSREEFIALVQDVQPAPYSRRLSEISDRQQDILKTGSSDEQLAFVVSDFQRKMVDWDQFSADSSIKTFLLPVEAEAISNAYVDSVWLVSPVVKAGEPCQFVARVRNSGELDLESVPINLVVDKVRRSVAAADIAAGGYTDVTLSFTPEVSGWMQGQVEITDNPVTFDDTYYISFEVATRLNVLAIRDRSESKYLNALYGADPFFRYTDAEVYQLDYASLREQDLVVISEVSELSSGLASALESFISDGGTVVIIPDSAADLVSYNRFFSALGVGGLGPVTISEEKTTQLALEDPLFEGVFTDMAKAGEQADLPVVKKYFTAEAGISGPREILLKLRSGASLLSRFRSAKGSLYVFSVPLEGSFSNLARHAVFVPVMYRIALLSRSHGPLAYEIGSDDQITLPGVRLTGEPVFHLIRPGTGFDVIPAFRTSGNQVSIKVHGQVTEAGNYELQLDKQALTEVSFNYNRDESEMRFFSAPELDEQASSMKIASLQTFDAGKADLAASVSSLTSGISLWKYCVILALIFLLLEILLLKFWKR